ncbi:hypothetical protein L1987_11785 [Smallanthus sonchifolius]|uniref:Uncharacterized protein n=1 Tax=Smallanthus sonchifolius TaxID=185202 RepID=A0ACB9JE72_9ASTR|nr:hypothetical protein L1987_11785 [Smallanthus sonchifolius]
MCDTSRFRLWRGVTVTRKEVDLKAVKVPPVGCGMALVRKGLALANLAHFSVNQFGHALQLALRKCDALSSVLVPNADTQDTRLVFLLLPFYKLNPRRIARVEFN